MALTTRWSDLRPPPSASTSQASAARRGARLLSRSAWLPATRTTRPRRRPPNALCATPSPSSLLCGSHAAFAAHWSLAASHSLTAATHRHRCRRQITITFNADVAEGMPWKFFPTQRQARTPTPRLLRSAHPRISAAVVFPRTVWVGRASSLSVPACVCPRCPYPLSGRRPPRREHPRILHRAQPLQRAYRGRVHLQRHAATRRALLYEDPMLLLRGAEAAARGEDRHAHLLLPGGASSCHHDHILVPVSLCGGQGLNRTMSPAALLMCAGSGLRNGPEDGQRQQPHVVLHLLEG